MTLDELDRINFEAKVAFRKKCEAEQRYCALDDERKAGTRAVVEALEDALFPDSTVEPQWDLGDAMGVMNKILASDGGSMGPSEVGGRAAVAEAPARPGDTRPVGSTTPVAAPVCEWRGSKDGQLAYMGCTKRLEWTYDRRKCPSCGNPIAFTEAK